MLSIVVLVVVWILDAIIIGVSYAWCADNIFPGLVEQGLVVARLGPGNALLIAFVVVAVKVFTIFVDALF